MSGAFGCWGAIKPVIVTRLKISYDRLSGFSTERLLRRATIQPIKPQLTPEQVRDLVLQSLEDDKGQDILTIPLHGKSAMADYMVIASGTSTRQVAAMAEKLEFKLKQAGIGVFGKEGARQADWVLLDTADVIVHLFRPEVREFYALERMWQVSNEADAPTATPEFA